ncbi:MAG: PEGA domain-containing protein, partial [Candidatus Wildermuthbacteria bacterium]|nr:PEGA domain-containing protein [Candidatus Wildermuthbacteria bacterium]
RMTKRQRTFLFFTAAILFFATTPAVVLYSQGWRLDWDHKTLTHTGGLYVRVNPPRASVFLNDSFVKRTDFFFDSAFITNLLPGEYSLRVEKEGYIPWKKTLSVQSSQVTEAKEVILFPENIAFQTLFSSIKNMWPSPNASLYIFQKQIDSKNWELISWNSQNKKETVLLFETSNNTSIENIAWSEDLKNVLVEISKNEKPRYLIWDLTGQETDACVRTPCDLDFITSSINKVIFSPINSKEVIFSTLAGSSSVIQKANYITRQKSTALAQDVISFTAEGKKLLWLEEISNSVTLYLESPDKKKLAFVNDSRLMVFFFETKKQVLLGTFTKAPKSLSWLGNEHILFSSGESINVAELDARGTSNIVQLGTFKNAELSWNPEQKSLFVLSEDKFLVSEKLLP